MDTDLLKTFLEVQRTRHFGKAAENLYLTQSAVSFRIRQLEQQLGVNLFSRYRNNIQLTAAGERLLPHAEAMLTTLQRAKQDVAVSAEQAAQLAIAATANIWDAFLLNSFIHLQQSLPALSWRAESFGREQTVRLILERNLDLAFLFDPPKVDEMQVEKLGMIRLLPVTTFEQNTAEYAMQQHYIFVDWGTSFHIQHAQNFPELPPPSLRTGNARIALGMILQNGGSAYLPEMMVQSLLENGQLRLISDAPVIAREVYAAALHKTPSAGLVQQIIHEVQQLLAEQ